MPNFKDIPVTNIHGTPLGRLYLTEEAVEFIETNLPHVRASFNYAVNPTNEKEKKIYSLHVVLDSAMYQTGISGQ